MARRRRHRRGKFRQRDGAYDFTIVRILHGGTWTIFLLDLHVALIRYNLKGTDFVSYDIRRGVPGIVALPHSLATFVHAVAGGADCFANEPSLIKLLDTIRIIRLLPADFFFPF